MTRPSERPLDILVWGATGYTGGLVAEYIARNYGIGRMSGRHPPLRWGLGGRVLARLERTRKALESVDARAHELPLWVGDADDRRSLDPIAKAARVVLSTAGPFAVHGRHLVDACVAAGTHYCDITGETHFIRAMIDDHHATARVGGTRIVHACGYDSIPSDLGTLMVHQAMRDAYGVACAEVKCFAAEARGGVSGGTVASVLSMAAEAANDARVRRVLADPYALDPERGASGPDSRDLRGVGWDRDFRSFTGPFAMAAINARVVRRTNALLGYAYGRNFRYHEAMMFGAGPRGLTAAVAAAAGLAGIKAALHVQPLRALLARTVLPKPGDGPSRETRENGFFVSRIVATGDAGRGKAQRKLFATVRGIQDPGYAETAKMVSESALCLALDGETLPPTGGVLTPGAAMGMRLVHRLRSAGMTFDVAEGGDAR